MSDFILEIFSEEIPALMQKSAAENLARIAAEVFAKNNFPLNNSDIKTFVSPRRLSLYIQDLKPVQTIPSVRKIGPRLTADQKAIDGFLKSVGLSDVSQLQKIENNGQPCYIYVTAESTIKTADIFKNSLPQILQKMTGAWPKLMRWDIENSKEQPQWIRPIRNILCLFGSEIIDVEFAGLKSNNITFTHYAHKVPKLEIKNAADYKTALKENFVIVSHIERKEKILQQIRKITFSLGLDLIDDEEKSALFDEVTGLCEWPTAMLAQIDKKFMHLPDEALILTLKLNQRYFCLKQQNGSLASQFIFISNALIKNDNAQIKIISDNEKVVKARLSDAEFFVSEDLKIPLISRLDQLKSVVFHKKLGSVYDKTRRLHHLTKFLSIFVPRSDLSMVERTIDLCKNDLVTKAVAELPELQGKIGSFYAINQGEDNRVVAAIYEHYLPLGANSELPKTPLGISLSIADKIDSIVGFFLASEKPTSSKDPFALRRAALGIIRIGFQHNIAFPIRILVEKSLSAYPAKLLKNLLTKEDSAAIDERKVLVEEIIKFFVERLKSYLKDTESVKPDIINVVIEEYLSDLDAHKNFDILYLAKKIKFLDYFVRDQKNRNIIELYKRSANILAIEEKKDGKKYEGKPSLLSLKNKYEKTLYHRTKQIRSDFKDLIIKGEFETAFKLFHVLEAPLAHFFDHVIINDKDAGARENRLLILSKIRVLFNQVADLSKVEI